MIRTATLFDAESIARIYNYYIDNSIITFETEHISAKEMASRIEQTLAEKLPYLVLEEQNHIIGYAYASKWKGRCAYRFSVESTVYLDHKATGRSFGTFLYTELFKQLKELEFHAVIGGISLPNPASIALHEKMGMTKVAHFKEVGFKFDNWIDVGYWQKLL